MDSFYWIVLAIAVVFLIIGLTATSMMLRHEDEEAVFPKSHAPCPDGWKSNPTIDVRGTTKTYTNSCKLPYGRANGDDTYDSNEDTPSARENANMGSFTTRKMLYEGTAIFNIDAYHDSDPGVGNHYGKTRDGATSHYDIVKDQDHGQLKLLQFPDTFTRCDKKAWADHHKIRWDGITNYNNC